MKMKPNPIKNLTVENVKYISLAPEFRDVLIKAYQAGLITEQEQVLYFNQLGDHTNDYSYFSNLIKDLKLKLAAHHTGKAGDTDTLFQFNTDWGMFDIRPILTAINWAGGVETLASTLDSVLFAYIDGLDELGEVEKKNIEVLKDLRTNLLRAGYLVELDAWRSRKNEKKLSHSLDHRFVEHRITVEEVAETA